MKTEIVPEKYSYAIARVRFELGRSIENISFMINKHLNDKDGSFLKSELYARLMDECIDRFLNLWSVELGIKLNLGFTEKAEIKVLDNATFEYYISE